MSEVIGVFVSTGFVFVVIVVAQLLVRSGALEPPVTRKMVHISVAHWWLIAMTLNSTLVGALVGPVFFVVFNFVSKKLGLMKALEPEGETGYGTVYFPISLVVLVFLTYGGPLPLFVGAAASLVMGYGDGLATLVGTAIPSPSVRLFAGRKSLAGSATMFLASAAVLFVVSIAGGFSVGTAVGAATAVAAVATIVEFFAPFGLDNITVPITTAVFYGFVFVPMVGGVA